MIWQNGLLLFIAGWCARAGGARLARGWKAGTPLRSFIPKKGVHDKRPPSVTEVV